MNKQKVLIIAEAGVNHNGSLSRAKELIDKAAEAGADFVKFQTFKAERIVSREAPKADYQTKNTGSEDGGQFEMLKQLELSEADHLTLIEYCNQRNIAFFSTAFDLESLEFLNQLGQDQFKVPSGEITNFPYLRQMAGYGKPVILSTGMSEMTEVQEAVEVLTTHGLNKDQVTVLHCNTEYPTPMEDVNLKAMLSIGEKLGVNVGYSDHTLGIEVPVAAVALGARVIEKHFTLDRELPGPDHRASLEPNELGHMVSSIRNIESAIAGSGEKTASGSERKNMVVVRKSIHIKQDIAAGQKLGEEHLIALRPGDGISPMQWEQVLNKEVKHDLPRFHKLDWNDLI